MSAPCGPRAANRWQSTRPRRIDLRPAELDHEPRVPGDEDEIAAPEAGPLEVLVERATDARPTRPRVGEQVLEIDEVQAAAGEVDRGPLVDHHCCHDARSSRRELIIVTTHPALGCIPSAWAGRAERGHGAGPAFPRRRPGIGQATAVPEVQLVQEGAQLEGVVRALRDEPLYGLDTEFQGERTYHPRLALVQIAWPGGLAIIDPMAVDVAPLAPVLAGPGTLIAHAGDQDLTILERACGVRPAHLFDTQIAAGFLGYGTPSLATLCERILGVRLAKGDRLTDWTRRPLTADQRAYAASDVEHLTPLHDELVGRLTEEGRLEWARDECEERRLRAHGRPDPATAWWRIKGSRQLRGKGAASRRKSARGASAKPSAPICRPASCSPTSRSRASCSARTAAKTSRGARPRRPPHATAPPTAILAAVETGSR